MQVFARGKSNAEWNCILGLGSNPTGGTAGAPVMNTKASARVILHFITAPSLGEVASTAPWESNKRNRGKLVADRW